MITPTQEQQLIIDKALEGKDLIIQAYAGASKSQPIWCKVQTPKGEICIGDIQIGDDIFSSDSTITKVIGKYPQGIKSYLKVTFDDGSYTYCNDEHLWAVYNDKGVYEIIELKDLYFVDDLNSYKIPCINKPLGYKESYHEIDSYDLGNMLANKSVYRIEDSYKYDSIHNRIMLMKGLIDIKGYVDEYDMLTLDLDDALLINDVKFICYQLGWVAYGKDSLKIIPNIKLYTEGKFKDIRTRYWNLRKFSAIEYVGECEQVCIKVNAPDSLYLTDNCIVTHNTTTLYLIANQMPNKRILYMAFNKSIATEASTKMPSNVTCKTVHSVAYSYSDKGILSKLKGKKLETKDFVQKYNVKSFDAFDEELNKVVKLSSFRLVGWVNKTVLNYMQSSDEHIGIHHVYIDYNYKHLKMKGLHKKLLESAIKVWDDMIDENGKYAISHDVYLKLFGLSGIDMKYDVILVDECQDVSGVMVSILQSQKNSQMIYVGDKFQKIYSFTGTIDITNRVNAEQLYLTKSFRFGDGIADIANTWLKKIDSNCKALKGNDTVTLMESNAIPDCIICRTNITVIMNYIQYKYKFPSLKINISCDTSDILYFAKSLIELDTKGSTEHKVLRFFTSSQSYYDYFQNTDEPIEYEVKKISKICLVLSAKKIIELLEDYKDYANPNLTITTAHKAKGLEWDTVLLGNDFNVDKTKSKEDLRLFYVAFTRAKKCLIGYNQYKPEDIELTKCDV